MKLIIITRPDLYQGEAEEITELFRCGLRTLHLRKPGSDHAAVEALLSKIPAEYHPHIVLHEHFPLTDVYRLQGIHLNGRNPLPPQGYTGQVSRSCHSLQEAVQAKAVCSYVFLSPIYDSISKEGYGSHFTTEELHKAQADGLIDEKVIALGGVCLARLPEVRSLGFGGAALLGEVWQCPRKERPALLERILTQCRG